MLISKIEKLKDNKYKVIIDGEAIITFDNVLLRNNLLYKKEIDQELYKTILSETDYYNNYNRVVKYILKRRRSEKEIKEYLKKLETNESDIDSMIGKLKDLKLINDEEYCKAYINDKINLSKQGINKIRIDLLNQDIPIEIIEKELSNVDVNLLNNRLEKLIIKKINSNKKYSNNQLKQRIVNEMINLGYNKENVLIILEHNMKEDFEILEKEFEKLYNKLSKRYSGSDLENKLKQKLLLKNFKIENINVLLQKKIEE